MLERDARARPTASELLRHPLMQEHLRRMQTEGLGRTMWLRRGRDGTQDETMSGAGRTAVGGAAAAKVSEYGRDAAAAREKSLRNGARHANGVVWEAVSPPKAPPELTPRERMTRRREMAIAERARVLSEAAAGNDTGEAARRRFRSEFHAGAASDATVEKQKPTVSTSGSFLSARGEAEVDALRKSRDAFDGVVGKGYYERIVRPDADADADASPASPESPGTAFRNFAAAVPAEAPPTDRDRDPVHALFGVKHTPPRGARGGGNGKKDPFAMTFGQEPAFSPYKSNAKNDRGGGGGDDDDDDDDGGILLPPPRRRTNGAGASVGAGALRSTHDEDDVAMIGTMRSSVGAVRTSTSSREPSARDPPGRGLSPTREVAEAEVLAALTLEAELDRGAEEEAARVAAAASAHANPVPVPVPSRADAAGDAPPAEHARGGAVAFVRVRRDDDDDVSRLVQRRRVRGVRSRGGRAREERAAGGGDDRREVAVAGDDLLEERGERGDVRRVFVVPRRDDDVRQAVGRERGVFSGRARADPRRSRCPRTTTRGASTGTTRRRRRRRRRAAGPKTHRRRVLRRPRTIGGRTRMPTRARRRPARATATATSRRG